MLHTKFRGNQSAGSREEDFEGFLPYMGMAASWSCDQHHINKFSFPCTQKFTYKFWLKTAKWFLRKACFNFHM